jgi:hypothetical protein
MDSYQAHHGPFEAITRAKILSDSPRTLDRITAPHRNAGSGRLGRKTGRASNRIRKFVPIRCSPQAFDEPGWFEADTVSHGGGSGGEFHNAVVEAYLLKRKRNVEWTRSRAYKKNDQAHVRQ